MTEFKFLGERSLKTVIIALFVNTQPKYSLTAYGVMSESSFQTILKNVALVLST